MDPEGVREVFYAECSSAPDYGVRTALRTLPFLCRYKESFFMGVHLPLTRRLPKRLDVTLQQHTGLHACDAIVLADIDAVVLDADDLLNLQAYVEGGGGLLLMGGPHAFTRAQRNWGPLCEALPASIELRPWKRTKLWNDPVEVDEPPQRQPVELVGPSRPASGTGGRVPARHPVVRGLNGSLGTVTTLQAIQPKSNAAVLATVGGQPLVVAGTYGRGRVLMVAAGPSGHETCMFRTPAWGDLLRQGLAWLMGRDADMVFEETGMESTPLAAGWNRLMAVLLADHIQPPLDSRAMVSKADPGWLSAGREPQWGSAEQQAARYHEGRIQFMFSPPSAGLWRVALEGKGQGWANVRIAQVEVRSPLGLRLWPRHGSYVTAAGRTLELGLAADRPVQAAVRVVDADGAEVWRKDGVATGAVDIPVPNVELGDYEVIAQAEGDEARLKFCVTDPLEKLAFSIGGYGGGDTEERAQWWFDYYRTRGFDTFATGLPDVMHDSPPPVSAAGKGFSPLAYQHYLVQRDGLRLWGEYLGAALVSTHGVRGEEGAKPTRPCIFDPEYDGRLRGILEPKFRAAASLPRMTTLEILDEPHLYRADICHCDRCREGFRGRYGYDLPTWDEALAAKGGKTRDYFEWINDYAAEAFKRGYEMWKGFRRERGGELPMLHHVLCAMGNGTVSANNAVAHDHKWTPHADFLEFDCYNYMYPHWRASDRIRWNEFHFMAGHFRFQALRNRQRVGFFIQVTDRDAPVTAWDPLRAPSETLYTAVGAGAKHFHLMAQGGFTNTQNCREEKFSALAGDIKKVQKVAPLLERAQSPRSRIAMVFNYHDRLYRFPKHYLPEGYVGLGFYGKDVRPIDTTWPYHKAPVNVAELLFRAFGEVDVVDQAALREGALDDYAGFVLCGVDYIDDADAKAVARFVERGGALICDHVPTHNLDGDVSELLSPLFKAGEQGHFYRDVALRRALAGKGRALLFSHDLNELYTSSIERDDPAVRYLIKDTIRGFFADAGIHPHVRSGNYEVEANVLLTADTAVLVVVNHAEDRQRATVSVFDPQGPVAYAYDLVTMRPYAFRTVGGHVEVDVDLAEREGLILGLYASVPTGLAVKPAAASCACGGRLAFDVELTDARGQRVRGDHIVEVCVADPQGRERRQFGGLVCAVNGLARVDAPLGINARRGKWTITAFDRFTTRQVQAEVVVQ